MLELFGVFPAFSFVPRKRVHVLMAVSAQVSTDEIVNLNTQAAPVRQTTHTSKMA